ncbi:MAG: hypothetical protein AAF376_04495 [Pseudomonadota bacterium]
MNTATSLFLAGAIALFLIVDGVFYDWSLSFFWALQFLRLLEWVAFWR